MATVRSFDRRKVEGTRVGVEITVFERESTAGTEYGGVPVKSKEVLKEVDDDAEDEVW